jgi:hypothetical protein
MQLANLTAPAAAGGAAEPWLGVVVEATLATAFAGDPPPQAASEPTTTATTTRGPTDRPPRWVGILAAGGCQVDIVPHSLIVVATLCDENGRAARVTGR